MGVKNHQRDVIPRYAPAAGASFGRGSSFFGLEAASVGLASISVRISLIFSDWLWFARVLFLVVVWRLPSMPGDTEMAA